MPFNPGIHHRKSIRLKEYDYSQPGIYFVTVNINEKSKEPGFLGKIVNETVILNEFGKIVNDVWSEIPTHFEGVELDEFIIMPDQIHGLIIINELENQTRKLEMQKQRSRGVFSEEFALKQRSLGSNSRFV